MCEGDSPNRLKTSEVCAAKIESGEKTPTMMSPSTVRSSPTKRSSSTSMSSSTPRLASNVPQSIRPKSVVHNIFASSIPPVSVGPISTVCPIWWPRPDPPVVREKVAPVVKSAPQAKARLLVTVSPSFSKPIIKRPVPPLTIPTQPAPIFRKPSVPSPTKKSVSMSRAGQLYVAPIDTVNGADKSRAPLPPMRNRSTKAAGVPFEIAKRSPPP